jgi:hypothetical protein
MNRNLTVILAALCIVFIIATAGSVVYYTSVIDDLNSQIANKPKIVIDGLTVEDYRRSTVHNLHIYGLVNNTGGGIAYNGFLQILAFNAEGVAIDTYYDFGGITGGMSLNLDFILDYTGSPIESWTITPIWNDEIPTPLDGTFPLKG